MFTFLNKPGELRFSCSPDSTLCAIAVSPKDPSVYIQVELHEIFSGQDGVSLYSIRPKMAASASGDI